MRPEGMIAFLQDLIDKGKAQTVKIECGPFVEPLEPWERERLNAFVTDAQMRGFMPTIVTDTNLQMVSAHAYVNSRRA